MLGCDSYALKAKGASKQIRTPAGGEVRQGNKDGPLVPPGAEKFISLSTNWEIICPSSLIDSANETTALIGLGKTCGLPSRHEITTLIGYFIFIYLFIYYLSTPRVAWARLRREISLHRNENK